MSALRLGNGPGSTTHRHNQRRALIVRRHRLMLQQERMAADYAGSPDDLWQLPESLVGE